MKERKTTLYEQFHCVGGSCPDTCCGGWTIDIDDDTLDAYAGLRGPLGRKIAAAVDWRGACFWQERGHCALLDAEGLCEIHKQLGEEALCDTCREFPRHVEEFRGIFEHHVNLSCPEAVHLLLTMEDPLYTAERDIEEEQDWDEEELLEYDDALFGQLEGFRKKLLALLKEKEAATVSFKPDLQTYNADFFGRVAGEYLEHAFALCFPGEALSFDPYGENWKRQSAELLPELTLVRDSWLPIRNQLESFLLTGTKEQRKCQRENFYRLLSTKPDKEQLYRKAILRLLAYSVNLYLPGAVYDGWVFTKAAIGVFFASLLEDALVIKTRDTGKLFEENDICLFVTALMRELEHNDDNLNALEEYLDRFFL